MIYLTTVNFARFIKSLELDIPNFYRKSFYWGSKLTHFAVDLAHFPATQAQVLVLADMLCQDIEKTMSRVVFARLLEEQEKWVYPISKSAYHKDKNCKLLHSDFVNVRIPTSIDPSRINEYREYFIKESPKYGYHASLREPMILCRRLKEKFNLSESLEDIEQDYFRKANFVNSDVEEFNATLDFETEIQRIQELASEFHQKVSEVNPEESRRAFILKSKAAEKDQRDFFGELEEMRMELYKRILNFYFQYLNEKGFNISEKLLQMVGFEPCKYCGHHH